LRRSRKGNATMIETDIAPEEARRSAVLQALNVLDTPAEERFDRITRTVARALNVPIALVSLVDANRHWFKSSVGLMLPEIPRNESFCEYTIQRDEIFIIKDTLADPIFAKNPLVTGEPHVRFYAGYPLRVSSTEYRVSSNGPAGAIAEVPSARYPGLHTCVGTLCVMDRSPRQMGAADLKVLQDLAAWVEHELALGRQGLVTEASHNSEMHLKAVLDNVTEGVITFNERGGIESLNPAAERMFGYKTRDIAGQSIKRLIPETFQSENTGHLSSRLLEGDLTIIGTHTAVTGRHKDGTAIPMDMSVSAVSGTTRWPDGSLYVGIVHDITRQRVAEEARRRSEALYQSVMTTVDEGILLQNVAGTVLAANAGAERILEVPAEQLLGRTHVMSRWRTLHEDGQAFPEEDHPAMRALQTGEAHVGVIMGLHMPNGTLKWVSVNSTRVAHRRSKEQGQALGEPGPAIRDLGLVLSSITDITEQRAAQNKLMQAQELYTAVCDSVTDFISVHDLKGVYLSASGGSVELLGHTPEELIKTNVFTQIHPEDTGLVMDAYRKLAATGGGCSIKYRIKRRGDEYLWVETHARAVAGLHVGDLEILCVSHKLREKRNMRASMQDEGKLVGEQGDAGEAQALRDDLTSLLNRRAMDELLNFKLASPRAANYPFGCLILDLDHFGMVNETYGREAGDAVLRKVGELLAESCRAEDYVSRYRDDEFVLVLPNTDASGTVLVAERIVNTVRVTTWPKLPPDEKITVSIGGTCIRRQSDLELNELLELITSQLEQAKTMGRDRLVMNARQTQI
jgi:diguanylate cyclase (GGDEF)-like protein/PAS domain S-box-containing protein